MKYSIIKVINGGYFIHAEGITDKASQSYNQKQLFIKDNKLCQALASISSGASFTENTNFKYTTLAEIIEPLIP